MAPPPAKMATNATAPSVRWSFVLDEFPEDWQDLLQSLERFAGGIAAPTTEHTVKRLNGYVEMKKKDRPFAAGLPKTAQWTKAAGTPEENYLDFVKKDDYFIWGDCKRLVPAPVCDFEPIGDKELQLAMLQWKDPGVDGVLTTCKQKDPYQSQFLPARSFDVFLHGHPAQDVIFDVSGVFFETDPAKRRDADTPKDIYDEEAIEVVAFVCGMKAGEFISSAVTIPRWTEKIFTASGAILDRRKLTHDYPMVEQAMQSFRAGKTEPDELMEAVAEAGSVVLQGLLKTLFPDEDYLEDVADDVARLLLRWC